MTVRVRYAPSPTGAPHIGGFRTALFDWLLARGSGGSFVLRIEDTDRGRFVPESLEGQMEALRWLGLDWDEGPDKGGPYAPYTQSERLDLYQGAARRLIEQGIAYECYCTPERLDAMRTEQQRNKQPPGYDGRCSTEAGRAAAKAEAGLDARPVVRFKMPDEGETVFNDYLRGEVRFQNSLLDDFVILKSDGFPTYHLAMPVDDHAMEITHVIRGEEWLPSAPRHMLLFQAFGYEMPIILHVSLVLGTDRAKLSKRHGAQSVLEYRAMGYLPEAVFNFLALLGWSMDDKTEIISRDELVKNFSIDRLIPSPAVFNIDKLDWMNGEYMRALSDQDFARLVISWLEKPEAEGGLPARVQRPLDFDYTMTLVPLVKERVKLASQSSQIMDFYYIPGELVLSAEELLGKAYSANRSRAREVLSEALVLAERTESWRADELEQAYRALAEQMGEKFRDFTAPIRVAITGRGVSPPLFESMQVIGRERCVLRLREAVNLL